MDNLPATLPANWGVAATEIDATDLIIPKVLPVNKMSKAVDNGAKFGQLIDSIEGTVLGDETTFLEAIVISFYKNWLIKEDKKFKEYLPFNTLTANLPYSEVINGVTIERNLQFNFYLLIVTEDGLSATPFLMTLSRTSTPTARKLITKFAALARKGLPSASETVKFHTRIGKNDQGSWVIVDYKPGRPTTKSELEEAATWYQQIQKSQVKEHTTEVDF